MRFLSRTLYLSVLAAVLIAVLPLNATVITYSDSASFIAATSPASPLTSIAFEGQAPANGFTTYNTSNGYQVDRVTFVGYSTASTYALTIVDSGTSSPNFNFSSGASLASPIYDRPSNATFLPFIRVTLPINVIAFGVDLMTVSPNALAYRVELQGLTVNVPTAVRPNRTFFGAISDTPISYIDFTVAGTVFNGGTYGLLDNFQFEQTPEPGTFILIGSGLIALSTIAKRFRGLKIVG